MPITKVHDDGTPAENLFEGRVVRIEEVEETRNWSDTMDYTDYRTTRCRYALVWLGTRGVPPELRGDRWHAVTHPYSTSVPRDLDFHEQFGWVDCTNLFGWRLGFRLEASCDADGEPLMWANLIAWDAYRKSEAAAAERKREEARRLKAAADAAAAAREAQKAAAVAATRPAAEALLAKVPPAGTTVTAGGVTGKVAWKGAKVHRGRWSARVGVKDAAGVMHWVDASAVV